MVVAEELSSLNEELMQTAGKLENDLAELPEGDGPASPTMAHVVVPDMAKLRTLADRMERLTASSYWPYPTYTDILYSVR